MRTSSAVRFFVFLAIFASGCVSTALRDAINSQFPPVNHVDHQVVAVKASAAELAAFTEDPTIYISLFRDDLRKLLPTSIAAKIKTSSSPTIEISAVKPSLDLNAQEVVVSTGFDIRIADQKTRVTGIAQTHCTASVERGSLVLRPSGSSLRLSSLQYNGSSAVEIIKPLINAALRAFLDNINGAIAAQRIPLRFQATKSIDLAETLRQTPGVTNSTGTKVTAGIALGSSAVLIDPSAVRVLGLAVFLTPPQFESSFNVLESRVKTKSNAPLTSAELAALAACSDPVQFAAMINAADATTVKKTCDAAEQGLQPIVTEHFPTTSDAYNVLAASYPAYHDGFIQRAQKVEPGSRLFADETIVALSRSALAKGLQTVLAGANASANYAGSIPAQSFNELITPTTTDLKCTENAGGCDSDFSYSAYNPRGCDSDCGGWCMKCVFGICTNVPCVDLQCAARKAGCEATKEKERQEYEAAKAAAKVRWSIEKAACELRKATTKAGCQLNQGWLDAWASKEIARIEGTASVPDLKVFAAIESVGLAPDFSSLNLKYQLRADARVNANAHLTPLNGGHLICAFPANLTLDATGHAEVLSKDVTATQLPPARNGDDLLLQYAVSGQQVALTFSPSLPVALFDQNTDKLLLSCPAPVAIVSSIPGFTTALVGLKVALRIRPDLFDSKRTIDIPGRTVAFALPAQEVAIDPRVGSPATKLRLLPEWGTNALLFSTKVQ